MNESCTCATMPRPRRATCDNQEVNNETMTNYNNLFLQSLVEANERRNRTKREEEEELIKDLAKEELEDDVAEQEQSDADADADAALAELGEPTEEDIDDAEQEALEQEAEEIENLDDPDAYDTSGNDDEPEEDAISDEELAALEAEEDQEGQEEVVPNEVAPDGDPKAQTQDQAVPPEEAPVPQEGEVDPETTGQIPEEGSIPQPEEEMPDFDYDDPNAAPQDAPTDAPAEGDPNAEVPQGADPNAAPADGTPEAPPDPDVQNLQVNILSLSKLDRALAKKHIYTLFMDLRSSITTALNIIDRNETVIDPTVRDDTVSALNRFQSDLDTFIAIKFPLVNYEAALQAYNIFTEQFNVYLEDVKNATSSTASTKHENKGGR